MTSPIANGTALEVWTKDGVKFGKELREKDFLFEKGYLNLNHGKIPFLSFYDNQRDGAQSLHHLNKLLAVCYFGY
jgi:hypothetical protein